MEYTTGFVETLISKSMSKNLKDSILEWEVIDHQYKPEICLCGKVLTCQHFKIQNIETAEIVILGSHCVLQFSPELHKKAIKKKQMNNTPELFCQICTTKKRKICKKEEYECPICTKDTNKKKLKLKNTQKTYNKHIEIGNNKKMKTGKYENKTYNTTLSINQSYKNFLEDFFESDIPQQYKPYCNWINKKELLEKDIEILIKSI
jgi:hypothetical protein